MTEQRWRSVAIVLAVVLVGLVGLIFFTDLPGGSPSPTNQPSFGLGSPSASAGGELPSGSPGSSVAPSASVVPSASASTGPSASPTNQPTAAQNRITFTGVKLDARSRSRRQGADLHLPHRRSRIGHGQADREELAGHDPVLPQGRGERHPGVPDWAAGTLTGSTSAKGKTTFSVTAIGAGQRDPDGRRPADVPGARAVGDRHERALRRDRLERLQRAQRPAEGQGRREHRGQGHLGRPSVRLHLLARRPHRPHRWWRLHRQRRRASTGPTPRPPTTSMAFSLVNSDAGFGITPLTMTVTWQ